MSTMLKRSIAYLCTLLLICACGKDAGYYLKKGKTLSKEYSLAFPFEYTSELIFVDVEINGVPARMILDTGAPNVLTREMHEKLQLDIVASNYMRDSNEKRSKVGYVVLDTIDLNGHKVLNTAASIIDLNAMQVFRCMEIDGILGANFFRYGILQLDYQKGEGHLTNDIDNLPKPVGPIVLPFRQNRAGTPKSTIVYRKNKFTDVTIDTGSGGFFTLGAYPSASLRSEKKIVPFVGITSHGAFGGSRDTAFYLADTIELAGVEFPNEIVTLKRGASQKVGNEIFERYTFTIDWIKNKAFLDPVIEYSPELKSKGFSMYWEEGKVRVMTIIPGSEAYEAGLRPDDEIISIDGKEVSGLTESEFCDMYGYLSGWNEIEMSRIGFISNAGEEIITLSRIDWLRN